MTDRVQFALAANFIDEERYEDALSLLRELNARNPESAVVLAKLGEVYWELQNLPIAIDCFRAATKHSPSSETVSLGLFHCLWENEQRIEALDEAKRFFHVADSADYRKIVRELNSSLTPRK
jgi:tetratricopeptide (TPR) repeat protein